MNFTSLESVVHQHLAKTFPAAQIEILQRGKRVYSECFGYLDPDSKLQLTANQTRFDFASVSKLFTVAAFMTLVEEQRVGLDRRVCEILPEFTGTRAIAPYPDPLHSGKFITVTPDDGTRVDARAVTFRNLLAHNSGLPAWLPLWKLSLRDEINIAVLATNFSYTTGARVVYSDIGLILIGWAMEKIAAKSLREIVRARVTAPLGLDSIDYGPISENVAPTEFYAHQRERMQGEAHDENAWALGGVAGHAGIFGTARDLAAFGEALRTNRLLKRNTLAEMTRLQSQDGAVRRGLGLALWSPDPASASNPLSEKSFGHTGFTGTSLFIDPTRELVIACLTNRVYYGRENAQAIGEFRVAMHRAICEVADG